MHFENPDMENRTSLKKIIFLQNSDYNLTAGLLWLTPCSGDLWKCPPVVHIKMTVGTGLCSSDLEILDLAQSLNLMFQSGIRNQGWKPNGQKDDGSGNKKRDEKREIKFYNN